jgi:hypothetical protein
VFETELEMDKEGMTVPYPRLFDDIRQNHGFVDVRGRPDLASKIVEGAQSPAMKSLLIKLAEPGSHFFTVGCDLGTKFQADDREYPHTAGGYIQIMSSAYAKRTPEDYAIRSSCCGNAACELRRPLLASPLPTETCPIQARHIHRHEGIAMDMVARLLE